MFKLWKGKISENSVLHENGQCVLWTGSRSRAGYGQFRFRDPRDSPGRGHRTVTVHRMALILHIGNIDILPSSQASHLCNNKCCVNPAHIVFEDNFTNNSRKTCFFQMILVLVAI